MADDWYYTQRNERQGPVSTAKLKSLAAEGWLTPTDLVRKEGMQNWVPASKVRGLFDSPLVPALTSTIDGIVAAPSPAAATTPHAAPPAARQTGTVASLDRLTHRCHILETTGESYRLQDAKRRRRRTD
ncbi:MAG: GYF domain-containing protein [Planctomycetaceae bacterium]